MYTVNQVRTALAKLPKTQLGYYPTPLHRLDRLSRQLGVEIYLKREDLSGFSPFGGNKIRKLEYLLGDALAQGCDHVITFGAVQSNHAMQTVASCRRLGLTPVLFLRKIVEPDRDARANLLLNEIMGAKTTITGSREEAEELAAEKVRLLEQSGHRCYVIPGGGASPAGSIGFIDGFCELTGQLENYGVNADYLFHATGSGGTLAGLAAGKKLLGSSIRIVSVAVGEKDDDYVPKVLALSGEALANLGFSLPVSAADIAIDHEFYLPGYEIPNAAASSSIRLLAQTEGILLDPVYTGKAFACLLHYIESGRIRPGSKVVFLHSGGSLALFAEKDIVGAWLTAKQA